MKPHKNAQVTEEWKKIARLDWQRMQRALRDEDSILAGFFLQQSIEKFVKAFLLSHGWKLKKIHRLDVLLEYAIKYNQNLEVFYDLCESISGYYMADRYPPFGILELSCEDVEKNIKEAKSFIQSMFLKEPKDA